jgi:hypothetical protein
LILFFLGTEYVIEITNGSDQRISVMTSVDGNKVTTSPIILRKGSKRTIKGFTLKRETSESLNELGKNVFSIEHHENPFVATRRAEGETKSTVIDDNIGTIDFVFTKVKFVNCSSGNQSKHSSKKSNSSHRQGSARSARAGVLQTVRGENVKIRFGSQVNNGGRRPVSDKKKIIGRMRITICDRDQSIFQGLFQGEETSALETKGN